MNFFSQDQKITFKILLNIDIWILKIFFNAYMIKCVNKLSKLKDVDKSGKHIKRKVKKTFEKKSNLNLTKIEKSSKKVVFRREK